MAKRSVYLQKNWLRDDLGNRKRNLLDPEAATLIYFRDVLAGCTATALADRFKRSQRQFQQKEDIMSHSHIDQQHQDELDLIRWEGEGGYIPPDQDEADPNLFPPEGTGQGRPLTDV